MTIRVIRLMNGEDLIGSLEVSSKKDSGLVYKLKDVGTINLVSTKDGGVGISLFPFAPYAEESEFTFKEEHVVTTFSPSVDLINNYNRMFGSGIQIASAGSIKGS